MPSRAWAACLVTFVSLVACSHRSPFVDGPALAFDAASGVVRTRVILVGDAGVRGAPVLSEVSARAARRPEITLVVFLGDNFYPEGFTRARSDEADTKLLPLIEAAREAGARALFIPGNHDWDDGGEEGYQAVLAQAAYVGGNLPYEDGFLPADGCPGPAVLDEFSGLRVVVLDTQWWLHAGDKPVEGCPHSTTESFSAALSDLLETDRPVVIAAHHPLSSFGRHAGFTEWREHLMPPLIGSLIALVRKLRPRRQDYASEHYRSMTEMFRSILGARRQAGRLTIWASGHDHSLQILEDVSADYVLVSGSGAKTTPVGHGPETVFAHSHPGFMVLDVIGGDQVRLDVIEPESGTVFSRTLGPR